MAQGIGVRSPYFFDLGTASALSIKLTITIDSVLVYSILKETDSSGNAGFEVSELLKDYVNPIYDGTLSNTPRTDYGKPISFGWTYYSNADGTGFISASGVSLDAYDAYAYFSDENASYTLPNNSIMLSHDVVWAPENTSGYFYYNYSNVLFRDEYSTTDTSESNLAGSITIKRFPCSKYTPIKLVFINRFGLPQDLWFFAKSIESNNTRRESYKSSNIAYNGVFDKHEHQKKSFHVNGTTTYTLNTGFISEDYNEFMRELLLSERVWAHIDGDVRPVIVTSSSISYKTALNDQMVDYSVEIEQANDLISTMR